MSRYTVKLHGIAIGHSELENVEPALSRAHGRFRPGTGYDLVQPVFRLFTEAVPNRGGPVRDEAKLDRYHRSRDALGLSLVDQSGRAIQTTAIHISDYSEREGGTIELEVLISDSLYWRQQDDDP